MLTGLVVESQAPLLLSVDRRRRNKRWCHSNVYGEAPPLMLNLKLPSDPPAHVGGSAVIGISIIKGDAGVYHPNQKMTPYMKDL